MKDKAESGKLKDEKFADAFEVSLTQVPPCFSILVFIEPLTLLLAGSCAAHLPDGPMPVNFFVKWHGEDFNEARAWLAENRAVIEAEARKKLLMMGSKN